MKRDQLWWKVICFTGVRMGTPILNLELLILNLELLILIISLFCYLPVGSWKVNKPLC